MEVEPGRRSGSVGGVSASHTEAASSPAAAQGLIPTCGPWLHVTHPPLHSLFPVTLYLDYK